MGRNQTQTTKDTYDRTLSDTTAAKSSVNQTSEEHDQLAEAMRDGEFGWASSLLQDPEVLVIARPASPEVGNPKIDPHAHPPDCLESGLVSLAQYVRPGSRPCSKHSVKWPACSATRRSRHLLSKPGVAG